MSKSPDAFRTISEVAEWLGIQAHVLRFWESKFNQVKPVKRAGGRRYYRPADMELLGGIRKLLHDDGMTIKGVQKVLREQGVAHVSALSQPLDNIVSDEPEMDETDVTVLQFKSAARHEDPVEGEAEADELFEQAAAAQAEPDPEPDPEPEPSAAPELPSFLNRRQSMPVDEPPAPPAPETEPEPEVVAKDTPPVSEAESPEPESAEPDSPDSVEAVSEPESPAVAEAPPEEPAAPKARVIDAPDPPETDALPYTPGLLAHLAKQGDLTPDQAREMAPDLAALRAWVDRAMASPYS